MIADDAPETLAFEGPLTLRQADHLRARLRDALLANRSIAIDCDGATEIDLSFLQLLIAARRSAEAAGQRVTLAADPSAPLRSALARGGFAIVADAGAYWFIGDAA